MERFLNFLEGGPENFRRYRGLDIAAGGIGLAAGLVVILVSLMEPIPGYNTLSGFMFLALGIAFASRGTAGFLHEGRRRLMTALRVVAAFSQIVGLVLAIAGFYWILGVYGGLISSGMVAAALILAVIYRRRKENQS